MNNKHQELIDKKVAEFTDQDHGDVLGLVTFFEETLQDTIDTVLEEERERMLEALTTPLDPEQILKGWEKYWIEVETDRFVENCIECDNAARILKALDKTPPNKV